MHDTMTERLQQTLGLEPPAAASLAAAILRAITEQLPPPDRATFAGKVPPALARAARAATDAPSSSLRLFYQRVAALSELSEARAVEAVQVVCEALLNMLDANARAWLAARWPDALGVLLLPRELPLRAPQSPHGQRRYPTLAEGRPGSSHPVSEAHPDRAHHESIARSDKPHSDTKLATSPGPTQVREHDALAEGDPWPARPLSSGRE